MDNAKKNILNGLHFVEISTKSSVAVRDIWSANFSEQNKVINNLPIYAGKFYSSKMYC